MKRLRLPTAFTPQLFEALRTYSGAKLKSDFIAGVIVGVVALPLAMAFAIASGVPPERGLYTAIVAGLLISVFGGSRVQIGGPTGAFVVIVYGIIQQYGEAGLLVVTLMAGAILVLLGLTKFGSLVKFVPYPVTLGFTSAIGVIIASQQIKDLLGLRMGAVPSTFFAKWSAYFDHWDSASGTTVAITLLALAILTVGQRFVKRVPSPFVALVVCTVIVQLFNLPVETVASRFGAIPNSLPTPEVPPLSLGDIGALVRPAMTVALLAAIESLMSAVAADGMLTEGPRTRSNMEIVALGIANLASAIFGGIPATGAIARTATKVRSGGRTPIAGIIHAITLFIIMIAFGRYAAMIPLCVLASILLVVAYNMSEWRSFVDLLRGPRSDVGVLVTTFGLTILFDLTVAVEVGMVMSAFLFMRRMAEVTNIGMVTRELDDSELPATYDFDRALLPDGVQVFDVNGPFFFGAADKIRDVLHTITRDPKVYILRMHNVPAIDATGIFLLEEFELRCRKSGTSLVICGIHTQPLFALEHANVMDVFGRENFTGEIHAAIARAEVLIAQRPDARGRAAKKPPHPHGP